ncbi:uncharacterized protein LOC114255542 [Monomorium pharaonis]|uniref:uncharacterized protein LOC114255542 n=1 Tax=Monomorium pharaonis TaxID=307658 RepID=UPI001747A5BF|nr:uncharacterized protein LOC114255542 [Monomorium pharaonis]
MSFDLILVLNTIADDWLKAKTNKELRVMTKRAQNARVITIFGYIFMCGAFGFLVFLPCFGTSLRYITNVTDPIKILPLQSHFLYDKDQSPYFELTFAAQTLLLIMASACYSGVDNLLGLLVFHLCGQMENLKERLINIKQLKNFNGNLAFIIKDHVRLIKFRIDFPARNFTYKNIYKYIHNMFIIHGKSFRFYNILKIIETFFRYFNIVENTFTLLLLGLLLYFATLFCVYGFLIIAILTEGREMSTIRLIYLLSAVLTVCGHMCLYCVVGEILIAQCEGIYHAAYNYEWYMLKPEEARNLIIIMVRVNKPLNITAGKMFPMTLSMFCNLIKTSGGYVSVLLARQSS